MRKIFILIFAIIFMSSIYITSWGAETVNGIGESTAGENNTALKKETLIIKTGKLNSTEDRIEGTDGMILIKGDVEINANRLLYFDKEKRAEITGNVILSHEKGEISSTTMEAWIDEDRYIFNEDVIMVQKLNDGEFNLTSPYLELLKENNSFQAEQGVLIEYNGRTLKGENVFYNDQEQTLELTTNVYIEEDNGDWVKSEKALFYLETEEFTAEGRVELELDISSN